MVVHIGAHAGPCGCYAVRALRSPNPTTSSRAHLRFAQSFPQSNRHLLQPCTIVYLWSSTPDPVPKADIKTKKYYGIYAVILSEGNFPNPFRCPASSKRAGFKCTPWLKITRQILTLQTTIKRRIYPIFYHFSPMGTVPQAIFHPSRNRY